MNKNIEKRFFILFVFFIIIFMMILREINRKSTDDVYSNATENYLFEKNNITDKSNTTLEKEFSYGPLPEEVIEKIKGKSWCEECPVGLEDLSYLKISYWGFDDKEHSGELIVHKNIALDIIDIFKELYGVKFPIDKVKLIDEYNANDEFSMKDNNTSAFCFRPITGSNSKLSKHSYGIAIDINPVQNPYVKGEIIQPEEGKEYLDRDNVRKGMISKGDSCYNSFKNRGWIWGGDWKSLKDYQHFEKNISIK